MPARRLASASAACQCCRSATTRKRRRACSMWSGSPGVTGSQAYRAGSAGWTPSIDSNQFFRSARWSASYRTTYGTPARGARHSRGIRGDGPCPYTRRGPGHAGRSWAECHSGASWRTATSTARTARTYARRAPASAEFLAWLDAVEAECETISGHPREALHLIEDAESNLAAGNEHASPDWFTWFSPVRLAAFKGNTQLKAGHLPSPSPGDTNRRTHQRNERR